MVSEGLVRLSSFENCLSEWKGGTQIWQLRLFTDRESQTSRRDMLWSWYSAWTRPGISTLDPHGQTRVSNNPNLEVSVQTSHLPSCCSFMCHWFLPHVFNLLLRSSAVSLSLSSPQSTIIIITILSSSPPLSLPSPSKAS